MIREQNEVFFHSTGGCEIVSLCLRTRSGRDHASAPECAAPAGPGDGRAARGAPDGARRTGARRPDAGSSAVRKSRSPAPRGGRRTPSVYQSPVRQDTHSASSEYVYRGGGSAAIYILTAHACLVLTAHACLVLTAHDRALRRASPRTRSHPSCNRTPRHGHRPSAGPSCASDRCRRRRQHLRLRR